MFCYNRETSSFNDNTLIYVMFQLTALENKLNQLNAVSHLAIKFPSLLFYYIITLYFVSTISGLRTVLGLATLTTDYIILFTEFSCVSSDISLLSYTIVELYSVMFVHFKFGFAVSVDQRMCQ